MKARLQLRLKVHLEDCDFADDLAVLSINRAGEDRYTGKLYAKQTGFNINTTKTRVMYANATPTGQITAHGDQTEFVENLTELGNLIGKDSGAQKDIKDRLGKACGAFARLQPIRSPCVGHHMAKGNLVGQKPPGAELS